MNTLEAAIHALSKGGWVSACLVVTSILLWTVAVLRYQIVRQPGYRPGAVSRALALSTHDADSHHHPKPSPRRRDSLLERFLEEVTHTLLVHPTESYRVSRAADRVSSDFASYRKILESLVLAAPLFGLLGTVGGMIDTFDSLRDLGARAGEQSAIAGGISRALVTTQLGLIIGVPGLICARLLTRLERNRKAELGRTLRELLHHEDLVR